MSHLYKYKLFYLISLLIFILSGSLFTTNFPLHGYLQANNAPVSFRFGYFGEQKNQLDLLGWMNQSMGVSLFAAADHLFEKTDKLPLHSFLPVFDSSSSANPESFEHNYSYLPTDLLPSYGRSVYYMDYGNARLLFLDTASITEGNNAQLDWLQKTISDNKQVHNFVLLNQDPGFPAFWETVRKLGVNLVLIQDNVYVPHAVLTQESAEYRSTAYPGWGLWDVYHQFSQPHMLIIEGTDNKLTVKVQDQKGNGLDQLKQDVVSIRYADSVNERAYISIQSLWHYHPGSKDIKAAVPVELDITGENPIQKPFTLPADDWRSPQYDDSSWEVGRAPLGHTQDKADQRKIQKTLPVNGDSPVYYFRKTFEIDDDPSKLSNLLLHISYEDGFVAYLNGSEIYRDSIREGLVDYRSLALPSEYNFYNLFSLKNHIGKLVKGTNTIAVEVHRSHPKAPNLLFDLSLSYEE